VVGGFPTQDCCGIRKIFNEKPTPHARILARKPPLSANAKLSACSRAQRTHSGNGGRLTGRG
jgi:hypothetical protein